MKRFRLSLVVWALLLGVTAPIFACLWDDDTLMMERRRFPTALELITGKFLRHTPEFYEWRIVDRLKRLETKSDNTAISDIPTLAGTSIPALYDDLAVAYEKTGQNGKAIETMLRKEKQHPGLYETYANLGTFYIHSGEYAKGIEQIERAIEINPDAHFGREVFQKLLVEYMLSKQKAGKLQLPLSSKRRIGNSSAGFAEFVMKDAKKEHKAALKGVLGMMRFGNHDSPILLEALGDLLLQYQEKTDDAKRLAARAYLKASYESKEAASRDAYRKLAYGALELQTRAFTGYSQLGFEEMEKDFQAELKEAEQWYAQLHKHEHLWISGSDDPDAAFAAKYYAEPIVVGNKPLIERLLTPTQLVWLIVAVVMILAVGGVIACRRLLARRQRMELGKPPTKAVE